MLVRSLRARSGSADGARAALMPRSISSIIMALPTDTDLGELGLSARP
ncbi:hypothetical protein STENM223S_07075 [Streptomyces tendae]